MKRELKKSVVYTLYGISFMLLLGAILLPVFATRKSKVDDFDYVSKGILDKESEVKVVTSDNSTLITRPHVDQDVKVVKNFYDYKGESETQERSLIFYEGTYMQSSGVSYSKGDVFDVVAILDGTVDSIKEDDVLGNVITITHDKGIVSVYQSVTDITVKEGDKVSQGAYIAKSSTSNISTDLNNHLYFELIKDGVCVNPEEYYGKNVNEL